MSVAAVRSLDYLARHANDWCNGMSDFTEARHADGAILRALVMECGDGPDCGCGSPVATAMLVAYPDLDADRWYCVSTLTGRIEITDETELAWENDDAVQESRRLALVLGVPWEWLEEGALRAILSQQYGYAQLVADPQGLAVVMRTDIEELKGHAAWARTMVEAAYSERSRAPERVGNARFN